MKNVKFHKILILLNESLISSQKKNDFHPFKIEIKNFHIRESLAYFRKRIKYFLSNPALSFKSQTPTTFIAIKSV